MGKKSRLNLGIDVGSTTVKVVVADPADNSILFSDYRRHNADQSGTLCIVLNEVKNQFGENEFSAAVCGSGGQTLARCINAHFIQEVVANSIVIRNFYRDVRVAIELGGQDAKVIFFRYEKNTGQIVPSDMRMNGSCAGGTGAFIDQIAELLNVRTEDMGMLASSGETVYDISGRCGVFAKTDIQPLLNQGVSKADIALSSFHAIAKQTIGGLAQGMEIRPKVIFEGGPLTFNKTLVEVFQKRLSLSGDEIIIPGNPETIVALGAAMSVDTMFREAENNFSIHKAVSLLETRQNNISEHNGESDQLFFSNEKKYRDFIERHTANPDKYISVPPAGDECLDVYIGIDAGSTTSKFVLIDRECRIVDTFYSSNRGEPLQVIKYALLRMRDKYVSKGITLNILGLGSTGYGEVLFAKAFKADYHTVETVAHAEAAQFFVPDVSFILDIGGQDMKAISLKKGVVTGIVLNEACSAGCGSFVETYAKSLSVPVEKISEYAFRSTNPSRLGSRCTVFMNSSIITEQKNGKTTADILAGISRSIIENVFTKVVRISNFDDLGEKIVVQGGTFKNDAVLRAFEQYTGRNVLRAPFPGEMGAFGIAILTKKYIEEKKAEDPSFSSAFPGFDAIENYTYTKNPGVICRFCSNNCSRTVIYFNHGEKYVTGNRCERGEIVGEIENPEIIKQLKDTHGRLSSVPDMFRLHNELIIKDYDFQRLSGDRGISVGIPVTLEFWNSLPFWKTVFTALGFKVVLSSRSSYDIFEKGLKYVPSDTVCFPAKLMHGHVENLVEKRVDRIFAPLMIRVPQENPTAEGNHTCALLQGYPMVVDKSNEVFSRSGVCFDSPIFHWYNEKLKTKQIADFFCSVFGIDKKTAAKAVKQGNASLKQFRDKMTSEGGKVLKLLEGTDRFAVVLAGRPYHSDMLVNHNLPNYFTSQGIPVLSLDSLPDLHRQNVSNVRMETTIPFHTRLDSAAIYAASHPNLEIVQIVSFGCGHDAITSDEMMRELRNRCDKELLILKLDEGESAGPLNIRIKSFIETVAARRKKNVFYSGSEITADKKVLYTKKDRKERIVLAPNLSPAFSSLISSVFSKDGIRMEPLPIADDRAIALGKKYVHNDICFPAQVNIGEALSMLEKNIYDPSCLALGVAKNCEACRAGQYAALARKALDEAGYPGIPIVTTGKDTKKIHPGFSLSLKRQLKTLWGITIIDSLEMMLRRIRPYEETEGEAERIYNNHIKKVCENICLNRERLLQMVQNAVEDFNSVRVNFTERKPRVGIVGEILMNYHPVANCFIENYLEKNGMEVVQPAMHDFFRKNPVIEKELGRRKMAPNPILHYIVNDMTEKVYNYVHNSVWNIIRDKFRFSESYGNINRIVQHIKPYIDITYFGAEGWKLPGEIMQMVEDGVRSFVIVQPFGCIPNHVTGRGMIKTVKKVFPDIQIIALDYDPDTSIANVENRLQMLILNARELEMISSSQMLNNA